MPIIKRHAIVPYTSEQMFDLVNNIEQYPDFLPWCQAVQTLSQGKHSVEARVQLAKGPWHQSFSTLNHIEPHSRISMRLLDGPFHYLTGNWNFEAMDAHSTRVHFELSFEFNNKLLSFTVGPIVQNVAASIVKAFMDRAHQVYAIKLYA